MHTFINCELPKVLNERSGILFMQTKFIKNFQFPDFCVPAISKTNNVRNLKQTTKVANIIHMYKC